MMRRNMRLAPGLRYRYQSLPNAPGLCLPGALLRRAHELGRFIDMQLEFMDKIERGPRLAAQMGRSVVFGCYQFASQLVALECWRLHESACREQRGIIIDNLTGVLAPDSTWLIYAQEIKNNLFSAPEHGQMAIKIYQLTSALLHSYPHLTKVVEELCFPYKDLSGQWHELGPWKAADLVADMVQWLEDIASLSLAPA